MKKLLALVLCLLLCLPVLAVAEAPRNDVTIPVPFDGFTLNLSGSDYYEIAEAKVSGSVYLMIYPNYDPNGDSPDSITISWYNGDAAAELSASDPVEYAAQYLTSVADAYILIDVPMNNAQVFEASFENGIYIALTYCELDFSTVLGEEYVLPCYQMLYYVCLSATDTYFITLTATTADGLQALIPYVESLSFN